MVIDAKLSLWNLHDLVNCKCVVWLNSEFNQMPHFELVKLYLCLNHGNYTRKRKNNLRCQRYENYDYCFAIYSSISINSFSQHMHFQCSKYFMRKLCILWEENIFFLQMKISQIYVAVEMFNICHKHLVTSYSIFFLQL